MAQGPIILTVEDEALISEYLGDVLRESGYTVVATTNALEAIAVLEKRRDVRLVITDINMPGSMDGLMLAAVVRNRWPPVKLIVATGRTRPARDQMPVGSAFLPKPYDPRAVIATVEQLL